MKKFGNADYGNNPQETLPRRSMGVRKESYSFASILRGVC